MQDNSRATPPPSYSVSPRASPYKQASPSLALAIVIFRLFLAKREGLPQDGGGYGLFTSFATLQEGVMGMGRVLVVDDEAHIRTTVRMALTKAGYDVVEAEDGEKGIQAIKSDDNPLMVDMILCDMQMPKIDGVGAISYFLQQFPSVPVVVMTGHPDVNAATKLMKQGVKDYLVKPIEKEKLLAVVAETVKQHVMFKDKFHA
jgi:two-component system, chemotaxis family, chemotaxis protein CheY